jgi:hypothetical protein
LAFGVKNMSRSYHVTKKKAVVAFLQDDHEPMFAASEKAWIKKKEKEARSAKATVGKAPINRAVVARERRRTANASSVVRYRSGGVKKEPN